MTNIYRCLESKFVRVNKLLVFIYSKEDDNTKMYKAKFIYQKVLYQEL